MIAGHYPIKKIMEMTGMSRQTIYKLESKGVIKFKRFTEGGKVYINLDELEKALK
jgi:excisionase family DNA binding protein